MLTPKQHELLMFIYERIRETGVSPSFDEMKEALDLRSKSGIHRLITALEDRGFIRRLRHKARALEVCKLPDSAAPAGAVAPRGSGITYLGRQADPGPSVSAPRAGGGSGSRLADASGLPERPSGGPRGVISGGMSGSGAGGGDSHQGDQRDGAGSDQGVEVPVMGRIAAGVPVEAISHSSHHIGVPMSMLGTGDHYALEVRGDSMIDAGILDGDTVIIQQSDNANNGDIVVALVDEQEATLKRLRRRGDSIALEAANPRYETRIYGPDRVRIQGRLVALLRHY